jgi:carboxylate-amine ligase
MDGVLRPGAGGRARRAGARPPARAELGSDAALEGIERILAEGNGADRQRAAHARGGMPALLDLLVAEAATPYG